MFGYHGRILNIDVTDGSCRIETFDNDFARCYLGGNGFAAKILYDREPPGISPFDESGVIVFAVGPVTGTQVPGGSRGLVAAKSPLNGLFFDSTFGGRFPSTLKDTGFETIVITGKSDRPIFIEVDENGARIEDASDLWGLTTDETVGILRRKFGPKTDVAAIGPAGENLVRFASIVHFWGGRSGVAGRGGLGAVLGAKAIKALVVKGGRKTKIAHPNLLKGFLKKQRKALSKGAATLSEFGTPVVVELAATMGAMGRRNLQSENCPQAQAIGSEAWSRTFQKHTTCAGCPVACGKISLVGSRSDPKVTWKTPEYESIYALGSMVEDYDPASILESNRICDLLGLDTITMGVTLSFALECLEKGLLSTAETGVPKLGFGRAKALRQLIKDTAFKKGFGRLLAEGSADLANRIGGHAKSLLYTAKKLELPGHSARILKGMSIGYATGTRGGSHHDTRPTLQYSPETDHLSPEGQAHYAIKSQHFTAVGDSLTLCRFVGERSLGGMLCQNYADLVNHMTGFDLTTKDLERIGERIFNLERAFNVREGVSRPNDLLPLRVMKEPVTDGPHQGSYCPRPELDLMLDEYYRLRNWSSQGIPSNRKLMELGLEFVVSGSLEK